MFIQMELIFTLCSNTATEGFCFSFFVGFFLDFIYLFDGKGEHKQEEGRRDKQTPC